MALEKSLKRTVTNSSKDKNGKAIKFSTSKVNYSDIAKETLKQGVNKKTPVKKTQKISTKNTNKKGSQIVTIEKNKRKFRLPKVSVKIFQVLLYVVVALSTVALVDLFFQYLNNDSSIAVVNGVRIPRSQYSKLVDETEDARSLADQLITSEIYRQVIADEKIIVTEADIDKMIADIKVQYGMTDEQIKEGVLSVYSSIAEYRDYLKLNKGVTELIDRRLTYSDADIETFFEENKAEAFTAIKDKKYTDLDEVAKATVKQTFLDSLFESKKNEILSGIVDDFMNKHSIQDNLAVKPEYGLFKSVTNIFNSITGRNSTSTATSTTN